MLYNILDILYYILDRLDITFDNILGIIIDYIINKLYDNILY